VGHHVRPGPVIANYLNSKRIAKELLMFLNYSKSFPYSNDLRLAVNQSTQPATAPAVPDCTFSRARGAEEKLTGILIILSILALILTF
jgi:hypothetical protein